MFILQKKTKLKIPNKISASWHKLPNTLKESDEVERNQEEKRDELELRHEQILNYKDIRMMIKKRRK